ncbi:MAG TPA: DUF2892 domain-containing protein [Roseateles sp.]|nr:DUF2892 domain-containing protein [Roseateles sp.]
MFYVKNVPNWERVLRVVGGLALGTAAVAAVDGGWGWLLGAGAVGALASGLFGFCPACALVGRRLRQGSK